MSDYFELVALNENGEERAFIRFDDEPWTAQQLAEILKRWVEVDPNRTVVLRPSTPSPAFMANRKG